MTAVMTPRPDPFTDAVCRQPDRLPRWWDVDAHKYERALAAQLCSRCPAQIACAEMASSLGDGASGTYAGRYHRWTSPKDLDDDAMAEFLTVFGPSAATSDNPMPTSPIPKPTRYGRYWIHPSQLRFNYQEAK